MIAVFTTSSQASVFSLAGQATGGLDSNGYIHTTECVFAHAWTRKLVHPIQGAALELSVPFQRTGEPGCAGSTAIRMALVKTEGGTAAGRLSPSQLTAFQKRPICPRCGCRG